MNFNPFFKSSTGSSEGIQLAILGGNLRKTNTESSAPQPVANPSKPANLAEWFGLISFFVVVDSLDDSRLVCSFIGVDGSEIGVGAVDLSGSAARDENAAVRQHVKAEAPVYRNNFD